MFKFASLMVVLAAASGVAACSDGGGSTRVGAPEAPAASGAREADPAPPRSATTTAPAAGPDLHGFRYCEILTLTRADDGSGTAEVWNTMGLNDCPQAAWDAIDPEAVRAELQVDAAVTNGPRYWVLDRIVPGKAMAGSLEVRDLDGVEMRSVALVHLEDASPRSTAYTETSVERDTDFVFDAGHTVHELTAPDGSVYVMQSFSQQVDPGLTIEQLASLGTRLDLPDGWTFTSRTLREDLHVEDTDGIATVVTDDLRNTYQLRADG